MSLGPANLGNLLVQRIDTALGVSQSTQNRTGAHPDALRQSQPGHRLVQGENQQRSTREGVDKSQQGRQSAVQGRQDPRLVGQQLQRYTDSRFTPSAPTTLGRTARTILALLTQFTNQPVQGQRPLFQPRQLAQLAQQHNHTTSNNPAASTSSARGPAVQAGNQTATQTTQTGRAAIPSTLSNSSQSTAAGTATTASPATGLNAQSPLSALANTAGGSSPLVNAFIQALSQNVQQSGMFYESHLAQLVKGQISPSQLQNQPQAQTQPTAAQPANTSTSAKGETQNQQQPTNPTTTLQQSGVDPSTQQTVRQQLDVLANQLFAWRGEAWPGVEMEWEVRRHQEDEENTNAQSDNNENNGHWQTKIRLNLPRLGEVEARLHIEGKSLRMHIQAPSAADQLNNNLQQLMQRLAAQGLNIEQLQVVRQNDNFNETPYE